ncbi:hypothetical protein GGI20_000749 [Coemansia sp. BCRC 34301]|nr:hypothetical protein GGI20_000749 [Coemansia sp. BCRC 34301]
MNSHPKVPLVIAWKGDLYHEVANVCDQHPLRARALFQVYLDLKYGQRLHVAGTPVLGSVNFPVVLVPGSNGLKPQVFVPVYADEKLSMKTLSTILEMANNLPMAASDIEDMSGVSVHLAIVESDSTIAFYKIGSDLHSPSQGTDTSSAHINLARKAESVGKCDDGGG